MSEEKRRAVFHANIVVSRSETARDGAALRLASTVLCRQGGGEPCGGCRDCRLAAAGTHPDIIFIDRPTDGKGRQRRGVYVDQIRHMAADAWVLPQEADRKVYIIRQAHKMNVQAQNAALKVLEEPPEWAVFILCADSAEELLPTIRSRCALIRAEEAEERFGGPEAEEYLRLAAGGDRTALCTFLTGRESLDSEGLGQFLEDVRAWLSAVILGKASLPGLSGREAARLLELCRRAEEYLRMNVGAKHVLGLLNVLSIAK